MDLFNSTPNLLPYDGTVIYYGKCIENTAANAYYDYLFQQIEWKNDEAIIFGKHILTKHRFVKAPNERSCKVRI